MECETRRQARRHLVAELGTSKSGGTINQLGCSTSVACHGSPRKQQQPGREAEHSPPSVVWLKKMHGRIPPFFHIPSLRVQGEPRDLSARLLYCTDRPRIRIKIPDRFYWKLKVLNFVHIHRVATKVKRACGRTCPIVPFFVLVVFSWNVNKTVGIVGTPNKRTVHFALTCNCNIMRNNRLFLPLNQFVLDL
jgi:hypothetical protein